MFLARPKVFAVALIVSTLFTSTITQALAADASAKCSCSERTTTMISPASRDKNSAPEAPKDFVGSMRMPQELVSHQHCACGPIHCIFSSKFTQGTVGLHDYAPVCVAAP